MCLPRRTTCRLSHHRTLVVCTGTQGSPVRSVPSQQGDPSTASDSRGRLVLHSARNSGNEGQVYEMFAGLTRLGARVVHHRNAGIHASGHATRDELKLLETLRPQIFVPVHGELSFLTSHAASEAGVNSVRVFENESVSHWRTGFFAKRGVSLSDSILTENIEASAALGVRELENPFQRCRVANGTKGPGATVRSTGVPKNGETMVRALEDWVRQELALLPAYTPPAEYEAAAKMICRRFLYQHTGKSRRSLRVSGGVE